MIFLWGWGEGSEKFNRSDVLFKDPATLKITKVNSILELGFQCIGYHVQANGQSQKAERTTPITVEQPGLLNWWTKGKGLHLWGQAYK